jgi:AraC-like DNA-binding protein
MDALETVLANFHFASTSYCALCTNRAPWGIALDRSEKIHFHAVRSGKCWIRLEGGPEVELKTGDFVVLPHGDPHDVIDDPSTRAVKAAELLAGIPRTSRWIVELGGTGLLSQMVCAGFVCTSGTQLPLISFLPKFVHLRASATASLEPILMLAENEMRTPQRATDVMLARIAELLLVESVRSYVATLRPGEGGWLAALQDAKICAVLKLIHDDPTRNWTLQALSAEAAMSRSSLTTRFRDLVGEPIHAYIARLRMVAAATLLQNGGRASLATIADKVGYKSESAFIRAFTRAIGVTPTTFRSQPGNISAPLSPRTEGSGRSQ